MMKKQLLILAAVMALLALVACSPAGNTTKGCPSATTGTQLLTNEEHGYCLLYPAEYYVAYPTENGTCLAPVVDSMQCHSANAFIVVDNAAGRTASQVADALVAELPGFNIERASLTIADEEAVVLDNLPGQDILRKVVIVHADRLYTLTFMPWDKNRGQEYTQLENLYAMVINSFNFLPGK